MNQYKLIYFDKSAGMDMPEELECEDMEEVLRRVKIQCGNYKRTKNESVGFQVIFLNDMEYKI